MPEPRPRTPEQLLAFAEFTAHSLLPWRHEARTEAVAKLRAEDPVLWALVRDRLSALAWAKFMKGVSPPPPVAPMSFTAFQDFLKAIAWWPEDWGRWPKVDYVI